MKKAVYLFLFIIGVGLFISGVCCTFHWWINLLFFLFLSLVVASSDASLGKRLAKIRRNKFKAA